MKIVRYLSIILYFMICFEGIQSNINVLYPCNVSGYTRLFVENGAQYPQVCTYINISAVETSYASISGLYFISFCYEGWSGSHSSEAFCKITGYLSNMGLINGLNNSNEDLPKYSNLACSGSETDIQMCGGNITTAQCNIVTNLYCDRCVSYTECLGDINSLCNEGICECKECVNGICYVGGCLCDGGYRGDECAESICNPPCGNGGVCNSDETCSCSFPYVGAACETNITCSPACSPGIECIVDLTQQAVYCCPGDESGIMCTTTQSTAITITLLNTTIQTTSIRIKTTNTGISTSGFDEYSVIMISIVIPLLCCLVIILYLVIICVCVFSMVFMTRMKLKMNKKLESKYYNGSFPPLPDERRPTVYTEINENTMLKYGKAPDLPPAIMEYEYIEMGSIGKPPVSKGSHYEIEDVMEVSATSCTGDKREVPLNIPESASPISKAEYSHSHQLIVNDKTNAVQDNESAYENSNSYP